MSVDIPGLSLTRPLYQSQRSLIYLAVRELDGVSVVVKTAQEEYPTRHEIARFQREYQIQQQLHSSGIPKVYDLVQMGNRPALLMEYVEGIPLSQLVAEEGPLPLAQFFNIAMQLAQIIGEIHQGAIIHKDIKPSNILWQPQQQRIYIIDFGIATELSAERHGQGEELFRGSLAYISPEQTGRMNRTIDYRTDLYSLGITFYQLLCGQLPFDEAQDSMGWIHCHIAREPQRLHERRTDIPEALSQVVAKLMEKGAEARYRSAFGLKNDLDQCRQRLLAGAANDELFIPGQRDFSDRFEIPQKLYGREQEIAVLMSAFSEVADGGSKMLLVGGYSGIGKSALINEVHKPIVGRNGYFIAGKFDQFQRNIPYSAISRAFQGLIQQLLAEPPERLQGWKESILEALGQSGQVIIDIIPELEQVIGEQPPVPHLGSEENQNRFNGLFLRFLALFTRREHPLVLFIDDLQWVDSATLALLKLFMLSGRSNYFLFLGAFRDNEVEPHHPFHRAVEEIRAGGVPVPQLTLRPLTLEHINQLVADTVSQEPQETAALAQLVHAKTAGNPFFVNQFLKSIHERGLIGFEVARLRWRWDLAAIHAEGISDNVVDLMLDKLAALPETARHLLRLGACIGNSFDLKTLSIISELPQSEVARRLWPAVKAGLLLSDGEGHALLKELDDAAIERDERFPTTVDRFLHDRVQQAAYSLIESDKKRQVHLQIARLLLREATEEELEGRLFDIVGHYNHSVALIDQQEERQTLANLNRRAGQRAREATAYHPALQYFRRGIEVLAGLTGADHYALMFELEKGQVECHFLLSAVEEGVQGADQLLRKCRRLEDKVAINNILILYYGGAGQMDRAIEIALDSLQLCGVAIPRNPNRSQLLLELARAKLRLGRRGAAELLAMPELTDGNVHTVLSLLKELIAPTYLQGRTSLLPYIILRMFNLTLAHGNGPVASFAYSGYALLWAKLDDFKEAHRFGVIAMEYNKRVDNPPMEARCYFMTTSFALYWRQPLRQARELRRIGLQKLVDTGEYFWASYIYLFGFWQEVLLAASVDEIVAFTAREIKFAEQAKQIEPFHVHTLHHNLLRNLAGEVTEPASLDFHGGEEAAALDYFKVNVTSTMGRFYHQVCRLVLEFGNESYDRAVTLAVDPAMTEEVIRDGTFTRVIFTLFSCLAILNASAANGHAEQRQRQSCYRARKAKLNRWYRLCPENFAPLWHLVEAEAARSPRREAAAIGHYEQAIRSARENGWLLLEAMANELFAKFWLRRANERVAAVYMAEARYLYYRWGAAGRVRGLDERYPQLLGRPSLVRPELREGTVSEGPLGTTTSTGSHETSLDFQTLAKVSQTLSGELAMERLLEKLMQFLIENAGAQKGILILRDETGEFTIEGAIEGAVGQSQVAVAQGVPLDNANNLCIPIVRYVIRTKELLVLDDAARQGHFTTNPYIVAEGVKSVLCLPLNDRGKLVGILYLENPLAAGAFTPNRVEILKVLSAEIAISLENARLYRNLEIYNQTLEERVRERTARLNAINEELVNKNQEIAESKQIIEQKNRHITNSILYAQQIQTALLPAEARIAEVFNGFFILYRPKEIVSGDFYWFNQMGQQSLLVVADCTGHGVPGALLSMIGNMLLNKIINEDRCLEPASILEQLHVSFRQVLRQFDREQQHEGMDIALVRIDSRERCLQFAGAKRPLYLLRCLGEEAQLTKIPGDRKSIGGRQKERQRLFTQQSVPFLPGDMIYLLTDGFVDQHDSHDRKLGSARFEAALVKVACEPPEVQQERLLQLLEAHQGDEIARDDVTVFGARLS